MSREAHRTNDNVTVSHAKCKRCGCDLPDDAVFCPFCGIRQVAAPHKKRTRANGTGSVYQLPNKKWRAIVTIVYTKDADGKTIRKTRSKEGFRTKKEALEYLPKLRTQPVSVPENITFAKLYEKWLPAHEKKVTKGTMDCYKAAYKHFEPIWYAKMSEIKTAALQECLEGKGRRTQQNMKALGTMLYRYAMKNDIVSKNYAELLETSGGSAEPREPFTEEEVQKMWKLYPSVPGLDSILILCYTGFRVGELMALKDTDLHHEQLDGEEFWYFVGGEKTEAGRNRIVPIPPKILPLVLGYRKEGYLFSKDGRKCSEDRFREKVYYPALEAAGLPKRVPHCCRHTYATLMKNVDNVSDRDKMAAIGHSSMTMTNHYTHADKKSLKRLAESL